MQAGVHLENCVLWDCIANNRYVDWIAVSGWISVVSGVGGLMNGFSPFDILATRHFERFDTRLEDSPLFQRYSYDI